MRNYIAAALIAASALTALPAQAQVTYYSSQAAFLAALGGTPLTEDFADTTLVSGLSYVSTVGTITGGVFSDRLVPAAQTTTFSFGQFINGFGGFWDLSPGGPGLGISFNPAPGSTLSMEVPNGYTGQFWGFISVNPFSSLLLTAGTQTGAAETYVLDDLTFGVQGAAVPEPAAWGMMIGGFGVAGMAMRRRQTKVRVSYAG
jgi:hypothetical protein